MNQGERPSDDVTLNPYAPSPQTLEERPEIQQFDVTSGGVPFAGQIDVQGITKTDFIALGVGLVIGGGFALLMGTAALMAMFDGQYSARGGAVILVGAALVTGLALMGFVHGQRSKPLRQFRWMSGAIDGTVFARRIDMRWEVGQASLLFPKILSAEEFVSSQGRMFVCREVCCFVPRDSLEPVAWDAVRRMKSRGGTEADTIASAPPPPTQEAYVWQADPSRFVDQRELHRALCSRHSWWPMVFVTSLALLFVWAPYEQWPLTVVSFIAVMWLISGIQWLLRLGSRYHWMIRHRKARRPWFTATHPRMVPHYERWMTEDRVLVGFSDGWIALPWMAFHRVVISPFGLEFKLTDKAVDGWFLERGDRDDEQWREIIQMVGEVARRVSVCGSVRQWR